jgi:RNA-directed DNA polymerase
MNEFDRFVKHKLKAKYYIRYADDFVVFSGNRIWLEQLIPQIQLFLKERLKLELHPNKVSIQTIASGVDFLGWVHFSDYRVLRRSTKRRMMKRVKDNPAKETINSYLGLIKHGNTFNIRRGIMYEISNLSINQFTNQPKIP